MSASLVGSEMCIRDRPRLNCLDRVCTLARPYSCLRSRRQAVVPQRTGCAVSYTHLTLPTICSV
eukprot:11059309-Alexandrium_andersonii.AAC.1